MILSTLLGNLNGSNKTANEIKSLKDELKSIFAGESVEFEVKPKEGKGFKKWWTDTKSSYQETIDSLIKGKSELNKALEGGFDSEKLDDYVKALDGLSFSQQKSIVNSTALDAAQKKELLTKLKNTAATKKNTAATMTSVGADGASAAANTAQAAALKLEEEQLEETDEELAKNIALTNASTASDTLNTGQKIVSGIESGIGAISKGGWIALVVVAIGALCAAIIKLGTETEKSLEELKSEFEDITSEIDSIKDDFDNLDKTVTDCSERFAELSQGIDDVTGKNVSLSTEEYEEFLDLSNQLANLFPTLTKGYDENGNAIVNLAGDVNAVNSALQDLINTERELVNLEMASKLPDAWKTYAEIDDKYEENVGRTKMEQASRKYMLDDIKNGNDVVMRSPFSGLSVATDEDYIYLSKLLENMGIDIDKVVDITTGLDKRQTATWDFSSLSTLEYNQLIKKIETDINRLGNDVISYQNQLASEKAGVGNYINNWLSTDWYYSQLDANEQNLISDILINTDWIGSLPDDVDKKDWDAVSTWLQNNLLYAIDNIDSEEIKTSLADVLNGEMTVESLQNLIDQLLTEEGFSADNPLILYLQTELDTKEEFESNFANLGHEIALTTLGIDEAEVGDNLDAYLNLGEKIYDFREQYSIDTQDELAAFKDAWKKSNGDLNKAFNLYIQYYNDKNKTLKKSFEEVFDAEDFSKTKEELLELAKAGELTPETLESVENYEKLLDETGLTVKDVCKEINNLIDATGRLSDMSSDLSLLGNAYTEFKEDGYASVDTIESLREKFGELKDSSGNIFFDDFATIIGSANTSAEDKQAAFNKLATIYLLQEQALGKLTDANKDYYITQLKAMGIANAQEIVEETLIAQRKAEEMQIKTLSDAKSGELDIIYDQIEALMDEGEATSIVCTALYELISAETIFNNSKLSTTDKIEELHKLASAFGITIDAINQATYESERNALFESYKHILSPENFERLLESFDNNYLTQAQDAINAEFKKLAEVEGTDFNGGNKTGNTKDSSESDFDWIEERLDDLNKALEKTKETAKDAFSGWTERSNAYKQTETDINNLIAEQKKAKARYMKEAEKSGLSQPYIDLVQKGKIDITKLSNDDPLTEQIQNYQEWYEKAEACDDAINQLYKDLEEAYRNSRSFRWETFDYLLEQISRVTEEAEYLIELLSNEDLFDDNGNMTKYADATLALHFSNIDTYKQMAKDYLEEMKPLEKEINNGTTNQETIDRYNELVDAHRDTVNAMNDEKQAVLDLVEEGYQAQLDALNELIDKKKESLNAEKDLYDYQKSVEEQSKKVTSLQRQYDVYKNDTSEEGMAQAQKIKVELEEAREELEQTQYDKYLSDQEMMLDKLSSDYEEWMNNRLDDEEALLKQIADGLAPDGAVVQTLKEIANKNGTEVSTDITSSIVNGTTTAINTIAKVIVEALGGDTSHLGNVGGYASGTRRSGKEWAWTQEEGVELIRTKDGALLTPLDNSMVFNNESSRRLWEFSQNPVEYLSKLGIQDIAPQINLSTPKLPEIARNVSSNPVVNLGGINIVCNEVSNADKIVNDLISNKKFEKAMYSAVGNAMTGGNSLSKYRY